MEKMTKTPLEIDDGLRGRLEDFDLKRLGERLKEIRLHLSARTPKKVTQTHISEILGIKDPNATLSNLESGKGTIGNFAKLLLLYHGLGYNPNWILLPDNRFENMLIETGGGQQAITEVDINELIYERTDRIKKAFNAIEIAGAFAPLLPAFL